MHHCHRNARPIFIRALALCAALLLQACGGGSDAAAPPVVVSPPPVVTPTAAFVAPATAAAHAAVAFDASGSASADGSALQYFWDFGNGQRGSGATIARMFDSGGAKSVTLTVIDGAGLSATQTKTVTVSAPAAAAGLVMVEGAVQTLAGVALEGVGVSVVGAATSGVTDALGKVRLSLGTDVPLTLKLVKSGYADQFVRLNMPPGAGADAHFDAAMRPRDAALTLADAAAGGSLAGRDGALLTLPADALVTLAGTAVTGAVQIAITPVDVTQPGAAGFPGSFDGIKATGVVTPIVSFGVAEYVLGAGGPALQLAPGKTATIEVPVYANRRIDGSPIALGDKLPLWSLDEATAVWVQEGEGTVVASTGSPSGLAMRATVSHFSWWNADIGFDPYGPKPKCVYDTDSGNPGSLDTFATATVCNMLAEFDRGPVAANALGDVVKRVAAVAVSPRVAGYSRRVVLPIAGDVTVPVPAGVNIALSATALNGSWSGRSIVNGAVGVQAQELIKMRPIATTGAGTEAIAAPFDATRSLAVGQVALFSFVGTTPRYARITVSQALGSTLTGRVRLLRGNTALASADFTAAAGQIVALLPADDTYTVELTPLSNAPGAYRLQLEVLGGVVSETLALPFDMTKSVPAFTVYRGSLTVPAAREVMLTYQRQTTIGTTVRVLSPDGTPLFSGPSSDTGVQSAVVALPAAGTYTLELAPDAGQAAGMRVLAEATSWQQVGPALEGADNGSALIDLIADRNGKVVAGYTRELSAAGQNVGTLLMLRRWTGTAWETAATDLTLDHPCGGTLSFAFDSNNDAVIAYGKTTSAFASFVAAKRFSNGAWQPLGANDGVLPRTSSGACSERPRLAPGVAGALALAYRVDNDVVLQRFDGVAWVAITDAAADTFAASGRNFDLAADGTGRLHFVLSSGGFAAQGIPSVVRRLAAGPTPAWEFLGTNGGALPETNSQGLFTPKLRFDASDSPLIGVLAASGGSWGTAVYRFNGTQWSTTGFFRADPSSFVQNNADYMGFAILGGEAFMSWQNSSSSQSGPVVQKNTAAGWTAVGAGLGAIPQDTANALSGGSFGGYTRMVAAGGELYFALANRPASQSTFGVTLLRKVAD